MRASSSLAVRDDDDDDVDDDDEWMSKSRRDARRTKKHQKKRADSGRATPVVESAVSSLSGIAHGGVQGLGWVKANEKTDDDGDVADAFVVCEEPSERGGGRRKR